MARGLTPARLVDPADDDLDHRPWYTLACATCHRTLARVEDALYAKGTSTDDPDDLLPQRVVGHRVELEAGLASRGRRHPLGVSRWYAPPSHHRQAGTTTLVRAPVVVTCWCGTENLVTV